MAQLEQFANKNLILVGNSVEILNYEKGEFIDSHDIVIRMGRGIPNPGGLEDNVKAIGSKVDVWCTGFLRENMIIMPHIKKVPIILLNRTRMYMKNPREGWHLKDFYTMFTDEELLEIYDEFKYVDTQSKKGMSEGDALDAEIKEIKNKTEPNYGRPSNGFITLLWLIRKANNWNSLTLIGFDFFAKYYPVKVGKARPQSWHLPYNKHTATPHRGLIEREYALDLNRDGVINWIILSDLREEVLNF